MSVHIKYRDKIVTAKYIAIDGIDVKNLFLINGYAEDNKEKSDYIIINTCKEKNNKLILIEKNDIKNYSYDENFQKFDYKNYKNIQINLKGEKQVQNAVVAIECIKLLRDLNYQISDKDLLDGLKNVISTNTNTNQKYISDISFSANDFILNSLLSFLPKKIIVHLNTKKDNFINFLELIFKDRLLLFNNGERI